MKYCACCYSVITFIFINLPVFLIIQKKESECLQLKILVLRNELERQKKALGQEVVLLHKEKIALQNKGSTFSAEHLKLQLQKESLNELRKECTVKRELFLKTNAQLTIRCRQLLSELSYIYPIDLVSFRFSGGKKIFFKRFLFEISSQSKHHCSSLNHMLCCYSFRS